MQILKVIVIVLEVLLFFNLMIVVHELGHFLAARWRGLVVERFGIWFGRPIWEKKINGIWYSLGSIPAGGFVALPQLAPMEAIEGRSDHDRAQLPPVTPLDKIIVAAAGPLFSLGLAVTFAILVWWVGRPVSESEATTTIGYVLPDSPAEKAGLRAGDRILAIDDQPVSRWSGITSDSVTWRIVRSEGETLRLRIERDGTFEELTATPRIPERRAWQRRATRQLQMLAAETPMVGAVEPGSAAERAGLKPSDLITHVNGVKLYSPLGISEYARKNPGEALTLTVKRGEQSLQLPFDPTGAVVGAVVPGSPAEKGGIRPGDRVVGVDGTRYRVAEEVGSHVQKNSSRELVFMLERDGQTREARVTPAVPVGETVPRIGVQWGGESGIVYDEYGRFEVIHPGPIEQVRLSMLAIVNTFDALISRKSDIKLQHMSGPVQIVRVYYILFENDQGWRQAVWFSVILNVNLALLNLLPIPVLDGGHMLFATIAKLRGRAIPPNVLVTTQSVFMVLLLSMVLYVSYFNVIRVHRMTSASAPSRQAAPEGPAQEPAVEPPAP
jgi:regulator of sigma E protease